MIGAGVGCDAGPEAGLVHLPVQRLQVLLRSDACPERALSPAGEAADAGQRHRKRWVTYAPEGSRDVLGLVTIHFADEPQGQVKLLIVLPAGVLDSTGEPQQPLADYGWGTDGDEEAVHGRSRLAQCGFEANRFRLKHFGNDTILGSRGGTFRRDGRVHNG
jgi:hypothetical protein